MHLSLVTSSFLLLPVLASSRTPQEHHLKLHTQSEEAAARREYFYVGGQYSGDGEGEYIFQDQMYVERLISTSSSSKPYPIVFIHGFDQTATNWLNKPDNTAGWATYFLNQGYDVYLLDQPVRGRSPPKPPSSNNTSNAFSLITALQASQIFTAPQNFSLWPQAALHTQWPGTGMMGDPYFDAFYATQFPSLINQTLQQDLIRTASIALLDRLATPVILLSHSQAGPTPWLLADARPELVQAIVALEPAGPPFFNLVPVGAGPARMYGVTDLPLEYDPPLDAGKLETEIRAPPAGKARFLIENCTVQREPARRLPNLEGVPVLVVTSEASYHARHDWCTVAYLQQAGVNATHLQLGEAGIHGNGHMFFLEKNSDEIAGLVEAWVQSIGA